MDISQYNTRVVQEPRGMIRIITLIFAILAFATTSGFDTTTKYTLTCLPYETPQLKVKGVVVVSNKFDVEYPFNFNDKKISGPYSCKDQNNTQQTVDIGVMDFSSSAQFYVATGVLGFLYSTACLVLYIFGSHYYETNPLISVIDLAASGVLTIFWLAGSCAWAAGVSDVKYYTNPNYLFKQLTFCNANNTGEDKPGYCNDDGPGKWTSLNISLIFGFANIFLWGASMWFVFKETQFHRKQMSSDQMAGVGGQQNFNQFGDQMGAQQQMPAQTHFPQQRQQFADGY